MMQIREEVYDEDRIHALSEQLVGFILRKILDPTGEFYHDGHIKLSIDYPHRHHEGPSTYIVNVTCIFLNICKPEVALFVYL